MINALNDRFISLFNPYDNSVPKLNNQLTEKLFTLITTNLANEQFIECLNHKKFLIYIFDNLSPSSIDNYIIVSAILLRFRPQINDEKLEIIVTRLVTMFDKSIEEIKLLIISNTKWLFHYNNRIIESFFSPLVLKDVESHPYQSDLDLELKQIQTLDGKEKYLRTFIPQFLQNIIKQSSFKPQIAELLEFLLAFKDKSRYLRFLLDTLSFVEMIGINAPVMEYFYYQDTILDFTQFQNILFVKFQLVIKDFSKIEELEENQIDVVLQCYNLPIVGDRTAKLKTLKKKLGIIKTYNNEISFNQLSKNKTISVSMDHPIHSREERMIRSFQNLKHFKMKELQEHLLRTVERFEVKADKKITGSSKYVVKPNSSLSLTSKTHILSSSVIDWSLDLELNSHGLKLNEQVVLIDLQKKDKSSTDPYNASGIQKFVSGTVVKIINNSKATIKIEGNFTTDFFEEATYNLIVKLPESLEHYYDELELQRSLLKSSDTPWSEVSFSPTNVKPLTLQLNCSIKQLSVAFPNYKFIAPENEEPASKRTKLSESSVSISAEDEVRNYKLVLDKETFKLQSKGDKTDEIQLNTEQLQALVSSLSHGFTFVKSIPGQGIKTIIASIIQSLDLEDEEGPVLILSKNPYFNQILTYKLVSEHILNFYDILDLKNTQYEDKLHEVANHLDQLQEEFKNDDLYRLEQYLQIRFRRFLEELSTCDDLESVKDSYFLKSHLDQHLVTEDRVLLSKAYTKHFAKIVHKFKVYEDLTLFSKYKRMNTDRYPSKVVFSERLSDVKDMRFTRVIVTEGSNSQISDILGSSRLHPENCKSVLVFDSNMSLPDFNTIALKAQYTKSNEVFNALKLIIPDLVHDQTQSSAIDIHQGIEYVELQSEEVLNFKKFYQNATEREFVLKLYQNIMKEHKERNISILVITPSETQKLLLQQLFSTKNISDAIVSLPHENKASEFDIVILSTTRTSVNHDITEHLVLDALEQTRYKLYIVSHSNVIKSINGIKLSKGLTVSLNQKKKINSVKDLE